MPEAPPAGSRSKVKVRAWDLPTRAFHWALVLLVLNAYLTRTQTADLRWHIWNGYAILVLIVFRVLWGFFGSSTARFASFLYRPSTTIGYARDFLLRRPRPFLGHNPLGGAVVFLMLGLIGAQAVLGLYAYDDHDSIAGGPLSSQASEKVVAAITAWHLSLFYYAILVVVILHVAANLLYLVWKRENLIGPMLTGSKRASAFEDQQETVPAPAWEAFACLAIAIVIVFGGIMLAGGKPF